MAIHVVFGSGQVGTPLASSLRAAGHEVRVVRRSNAAGGDALVGDLADRAFAERAALGADVIHQVAVPAYHRWHAELPALTEGVLHAARTSGARLVVLDNLYLHGPTDGRPMRESDVATPCSKKGELRRRIAERYLDAHGRGEARVTLARASDFFGPGVVQSTLGDRFYARIVRGQAGECLGDPSLPHAFTFVPDLVRAMVALAENPDADGSVWHVPTLPARPLREYADALGRALGLGTVRLTTTPPWVLHTVGLFVPALRELAEMRYQWSAPYRLDSSRFEAAFGLAATSFETQIAATARWVEATYRVGRDAARR